MKRWYEIPRIRTWADMCPRNCYQHLRQLGHHTCHSRCFQKVGMMYIWACKQLYNKASTLVILQTNSVTHMQNYWNKYYIHVNNMKKKIKIVCDTVNPDLWPFWGRYEGKGWRHPPEENNKFSYIYSVCREKVNQFRSYSLYIRFYPN